MSWIVELAALLYIMKTLGPIVLSILGFVIGLTIAIFSLICEATAPALKVIEKNFKQIGIVLLLVALLVIISKSSLGNVLLILCAGAFFLGLLSIIIWLISVWVLELIKLIFRKH